jgi:hypothetical protein
MTPTTTTTDRLAELVAAKLKVLGLLNHLAQRQLDLAASGEMSDLLKLLAAKQTVLAQLSQLERLLDPFRVEDPESRLWRSATDRRRCQDDANRANDLLDQTMQLERQAETLMLRRRDAAADALAGVGAAAHATSAYAGEPLPSPALAQLHCEG